MSHIIKDTIDLDVVKYFYKNLDIDNLSIKFLEEVLEEFLPRDNNNDLLVKYDVKEKGIHTAIYYPSSNHIILSIVKLQNWLRLNGYDLANYYNISNLSSFEKYLLMYVLTHEIEHSYQHLMALGKIDSPCQLVRDGYNGITDLFIKKSYIIPRPIKEVRKSLSVFLYKMHENEYVLERNANVESLDLVSKLADSNGDKEAFDAFINMLHTFMILGYTNNSQGSFYETYKGILMEDKYNKINQDHNLSFEDAVRYGLPIKEEERNKVLSLVKKRNYEK